MSKSARTGNSSERSQLLALLDKGATFLADGRLTDAAECFRMVLLHEPRHVGALNNLAHVDQSAGKLDEALAQFLELLQFARKPLAYRVASNVIQLLQYMPGYTETKLRNLAEQLGSQLGEEHPLPFCSRYSGAIKIGFVSADLCAHPVGYFLLPLLQHINRDRFQVYMYGHHVRNDWASREIRRLGQWFDISQMGDSEVVAAIRSEALDILVDLSGHTAGNRLPVFAMRAAPVQISWLGYCGTTGIHAMDYTIMDSWHVPEGSEKQFSEDVIRLKNRFCFQSLPFTPAVAAPPCRNHGYVTFGSYNNTAKYNLSVFEAWASILRSVPKSRLILQWRTFADNAYRNRVIAIFESMGVLRKRIELRPASTHYELLQRYADIDIALDPFPFSGGYTSLEALWMGVPVITLPLLRPVSRQTLAIIGSLQNPRWMRTWIAENPDDYVIKACSLAQDRNELNRIRTSLRNKMLKSSIMNAEFFTKNVEIAFQNIVSR